MADEAKYEKPNSQVDLEKRLAKGNRSDRVLSTSDDYVGRGSDGDERDFAVEDNDTSGFVNVDPEYKTYANETEKPLRSEGGPEAELENLILGEAEDKKSKPAKKTAAKKTASRRSS